MQLPLHVYEQWRRDLSLRRFFHLSMLEQVCTSISLRRYWYSRCVGGLEWGCTA